MKKVLIGVGIGCGVLVLLAVVGMGIVGFWAKKTFGGAVEAGQQADVQNKELKALNQKYAFTPPPEGEVLALQESRLNDYFAVRDAALPVFKEFEEKSKELNKATEDGAKPSITDAMQAGGMLVELTVKTRASYIDGLKQHKMSPKEFLAITGAIFNSHVATATGEAKKAMAGMREDAQKALADVQAKLQADDLGEEERTSLEEQQASLQSQLDGMNEMGDEGIEVSEKAQGVAATNLKLLEKFKDRVEKSFNPTFDALIVTDDNKNPFGMIGQQKGE